MNPELKFKISAGRTRIGTPLEVAPIGATTDANRQVLETSDANIIYFNTDTGNDTTGNGAVNNPYATYSKCVTEWTTGKTIRCQNTTAIQTNITRPLDVSQGEILTVTQTDFSYNDSANVNIFTGNFPVLFGVISNNLSYSSDGTTWTTITTGLTVSLIRSVLFQNNVYAITFSTGSTEHYIKLDSNLSRLEFNEIPILINGISVIPGQIISIPSTGIQFIYNDSNDVFVISGAKNFSIQSLSQTNINGVGVLVDTSIYLLMYNESDFTFYIYTYDKTLTLLGTLLTESDSGIIINSLTKNDTYIYIGLTYDIGTKKYTFRLSDATVTEVSNLPSPFTKDTSAIQINDEIFVGYYTGSGTRSRYAKLTAIDTLTEQTIVNASWENTSISGVDTRLSAISGRVVLNSSLSGTNIYVIQDQIEVSASVCGVLFRGWVNATAPDQFLNCTATVCSVSGQADFKNNKSENLTIQSADLDMNSNLIVGDLAVDVSGIANVNDVSISNNTIIGDATVTAYSQVEAQRIFLADNILEGDISCTFAGLKWLSGNQRGDRFNTVYEILSSNNPQFRNSDYELSRKLLGDSINSPMIGASVYSVNPDGSARDYGCYQIQDPPLEYEFKRSFYANRPNTGYQITKQNVAKSLTALDGTPDVSNIPDRASATLVIENELLADYDHLVFQDYLDSLQDTTCKINLFPDQEIFSATVTTSASHSIGDVVLNINTANVEPGAIIQIGGKNYYSVYSASTTQIVLDRPLESAINSGVSLTVTGIMTEDEWLYVPSDSRSIIIPAQEVTGGLVGQIRWSFVKKWPS